MNRATKILLSAGEPFFRLHVHIRIKNLQILQISKIAGGELKFQNQKFFKNQKKIILKFQFPPRDFGNLQFLTKKNSKEKQPTKFWLSSREQNFSSPIHIQKIGRAHV